MPCLFVEWLLGEDGGGQLLIGHMSEIKPNKKMFNRWALNLWFVTSGSTTGIRSTVAGQKWTNLRTELAFNPVEVVVQIASLHQVPTPGCELSNDSCCLQNDRKDTVFHCGKKKQAKTKARLVKNFEGEKNKRINVGMGRRRPKTVDIVKEILSTSVLKGLHESLTRDRGQIMKKIEFLLFQTQDASK